MFNINFADDWIRTTDLWYQEQPLYQLSHNHFPDVLPHQPSPKERKWKKLFEM